MPLHATQTAARAFPLAGPQVAAEAVSATMRLWDARMALLKRQPLVALAFYAIALHENRADNNIGSNHQLAALAHEAKRALQRENIDLALIDDLYPPATCGVYAVRG